METKKPKDSTETKPQTPQSPHWIWWLVLLGVMAWNAWLLLPARQPQANISYSAFVDQVQQDNVAGVTIADSAITGQLNKAIVWPPATPTPASTAASTPAPTGTAATPAVAGVAAGTPLTYTDFQTNFPETVGDTTLMPLLESHGVTVNVAPPPSPWLALILSNGLPLLLLVLLLVWMGRQATQSQSGIFGFGRSKARRYTHGGESPEVTFKDVAGADEAKSELQEVVDFLRQPDKYHIIGARIPRGVLLVGPPGTGKTLLARAVAGEAGVPFFNISASEFVEMFVGVGASRVRDLFQEAKNAAPAIVFIDELDAVGRRRGAGVGMVNDEREQTLNQLLVEMDGFDERQEVILLAATNRADVLDPALLRPGRFDRQVMVGLPDRQGREGILRIHTEKIRLADNVDLRLLARTTTGFSGADLANLCNEAALNAARHHGLEVHMDDFEEAVDKILLGGVRPLLLDAHDRQVVAYHEAGHALVAWLTPEADPVHKVTIIPHGRALGVTEQLPGEDHYNYSRSYLMARLAVMVGGRSAEEIAFGDVTTGAENDLIEATRLARHMVTRWGMSNLGLIAFQADEEHPFLGYDLSQGKEYSETTATRIDAEIQRLLGESHDSVRRVLAAERGRLDRLVQALLSEETIDRNEMEKLLGRRAGGSALPSTEVVRVAENVPATVG